MRIEDIATSYGISKAHLLKSSRQLGQLGYLTTLRGRSGGVKLALPPEKIALGEVLREIEDTSEFVECFKPATNTCPLAGECKLTGLFHQGIEAFFSSMDGITIADLVSDGRRLRDRLPALELL